MARRGLMTLLHRATVSSRAAVSTNKGLIQTGVCCPRLAVIQRNKSMMPLYMYFYDYAHLRSVFIMRYDVKCMVTH